MRSLSSLITQVAIFAVLLCAPTIASAHTITTPSPTPTPLRWYGAYVGLGGGAGTIPNGYGHLLGVQVGTERQAHRMVFGIEGDFQSSNLYRSTTTSSECIHWFATARARLGVLLSPHALLYATGGYEEAGIDLQSTTSSGSTSATTVRGGFVYGTGLEIAASSRLSLRLEALRSNLGTFGSPVVIRAGANWRLP